MRRLVFALLTVAVLGAALPAHAREPGVEGGNLTVVSNETASTQADTTCITPYLAIGLRHTGTCTNGTDVDCPPAQHPIVKVYFKVANGGGTKTEATAVMDDNDNDPRSNTNYNDTNLSSASWSNVVNRGGGAGDLGDIVTYGQGSGWIQVNQSNSRFYLLVRNSCTF